MRRNFNTNLSGCALKTEMFANYEKCVPGKEEELLY
jgi:hypothetical protein